MDLGKAAQHLGCSEGDKEIPNRALQSWPRPVALQGAFANLEPIVGSGLPGIGQR